MAGLSGAIEPQEDDDRQRDERSTAPSSVHPAASLFSVAQNASLLSWGDGSAPSEPSIDSDASTHDTMSINSSFRSSTMSVNSSVFQFVDENGRTYHKYKDGKYMLPNDSEEQERLDLQHQLFVITANGRLNLAPLSPNIRRVLDLATGTGIWAIDFAQRHPDTKVIGTDLSPIQPAYLPSNCEFEIDDSEDEWTYHEPFDYIHARAVVTCFADPAQVIQQGFQNLAPGGWMEMQDAVFPLEFVGGAPPNSALRRWSDLVIEGGARAGRPWTNVRNYQRYFREAGFEEVTEKKFFWPTSPWAKGKYFKTVSMYLQEDMLSGLEGVSLRVLGMLGWSAEQVKDFVKDVKKEVLDTNVHCYFPILFVYGRKPLNS